MNTEPKLPVVYFQIKKLKEIWTKSSSPNKQMYIDLFNDSLKEIEKEYLSELEEYN